MIENGKAKISLYLSESTQLADKEVEFLIDFDNHNLELSFSESDLFDEKDDLFTDAIELLIPAKRHFTFYKCYPIKISKMRCMYFFEIYTDAMYIDNFENMKCNSIEFIVNASPIPLTPIAFLPEYSELESDNIVISCIGCKEGVLVGLSDNAEMKYIDDFETVFFNILDITFLCNGFYPYIIKEIICMNENRVEINRIQQSLYKEGQSFSHWIKLITCARDLNLGDAYIKYINLINRNKLIIPTLRNVLHSKDKYADLVLCNLIQCVEGYMRKTHIKEKFPKILVNDIKGKIEEVVLSYELPKNLGTTLDKIHDSIMGLIGNINQPNFNECLDSAIKFNENTKAVFDREIENKQLDDFINRSKKTRNQFSHMVPIKDSFEEGLELYRAINKYSVLLRIIILSDIGIETHKSTITRYVREINGD
ncbi:MAG: hypothetical protein LUG90_19255 [Clostridiaceae bacterium]|nr:hypothetical protein [Clostridiaceae bacterium]